MTRKDYINIAAAILATQTRIKAEYEGLDRMGRAMHFATVGVRRTAEHLAEFLADDNPRFDKARFLTACGYGASVPRSVDEIAERIGA